MNRFYFGDSDSSASDLDDDDANTLPYPKPLARSAFLTPNFDPTTFLSTLHNRHQTLEDLRAELRTRSQELSKELLDLVNDNYQDFLSLGSSLRGGEEKVEEVRVGLLGFQRDVEGLSGKVEGRRKEVEGLVEERRRVRREVRLGRGLLEVERRIEELEERLMVGGEGGTVRTGAGTGDDLELSDSDESEEEDEDGAADNTVPVSRLRRRVRQFIVIKRLMARVGFEHPFMVKQEERILRVRQTLLLDVSNALKQTPVTSEQDTARMLKILGLYRDMGEPGDALQVLRQRTR